MHIAAKTPVLEQLWLSDTPIALLRGWEGEWDKLWPKLSSLTILFYEGLAPAVRIACAISVAASIQRAESIRHIDFAFRWTYGETAYPKDLLSEQPAKGLDPSLLPASATDDIWRPNNYKSLQSLRLSGISLDPTVTGQLLEQQAKSGQLNNIDIVFPLEPLQATQGELCASHLAGYEWLCGSPSVQSMGIFQFRFRSFPRNDVDLPLPNFLASFPKLEVLEIKSDNYDELEFCSVLEAIMKVTKLNVIYQGQVKGALMDKLVTLARSRGVEVIWGERPRQWPVPL